jgi:hypothetical protein
MPRRPPRVSEQPTNSDTPSVSIATAAAGLPAARYATACVGIVAAAALATRSAPSAGFAVFGGAIMLVAMALLVIVARLATARDPVLFAALRWPTVVLAWGAVFAALVVVALLISTTFWGRPVGHHDERPSRQEQTGMNTAPDTLRAGDATCWQRYLI